MWWTRFRTALATGNYPIYEPAIAATRIFDPVREIQSPE